MVSYNSKRSHPKSNLSLLSIMAKKKVKARRTDNGIWKRQMLLYGQHADDSAVGLADITCVEVNSPSRIRKQRGEIPAEESPIFCFIANWGKVSLIWQKNPRPNLIASLGLSRHQQGPGGPSSPSESGQVPPEEMAVFALLPLGSPQPQPNKENNEHTPTVARVSTPKTLPVARVSKPFSPKPKQGKGFAVVSWASIAKYQSYAADACNHISGLTWENHSLKNQNHHLKSYVALAVWLVRTTLCGTKTTCWKTKTYFEELCRGYPQPHWWAVRRKPFFEETKPSPQKLSSLPPQLQGYLWLPMSWLKERPQWQWTFSPSGNSFHLGVWDKFPCS